MSSRVVGLRDRPFQPLALADEFAADVDVAIVHAHGAAGDQAALDQKMRIVPHDLAILARAGLRLVGVDDEITRPAIGLLGHERPFQPGRKSRAAAAALARGFHFVNDGVAAFFQDRLGAVPGAARARAIEVPAMMAVEIFEDAVLVGEHFLTAPRPMQVSGRLCRRPATRRWTDQQASSLCRSTGRSAYWRRRSARNSAGRSADPASGSVRPPIR